MDDDFKDRLDTDMTELREEFKLYSRDDLCQVLDHYVSTVGKEKTIGTREYNAYIELLTEEINKRL